MAGRAIFRESAIEAHRRRSTRDVVPRLVPGPVIACCWVLLATLLGAVLVAWTVRVPTYVGASGVVVGRRAAVLFVSPDDSTRLRPGRPVHGQIGSSGRYVKGAVAKVDAPLIGPTSARKRYGIRAGTGVLTEPATSVAVRLAATLPPGAYAGSRLTARVESGSRRLLALVPGLGKLAGGGS